MKKNNEYKTMTKKCFEQPPPEPPPPDPCEEYKIRQQLIKEYKLKTKDKFGIRIKKCIIEPTPEPPPPDPCKVQKIRQLEKAGFKICPKPPVPQPAPPDPCLALCIERIKNPPVIVKGRGQPVICVVERQMPGTKCERIEAKSIASPLETRPRCPPPPTIPPPPTPDPCEEQAERERIAECKERMKRYLE